MLELRTNQYLFRKIFLGLVDTGILPLWRNDSMSLICLNKFNHEYPINGIKSILLLAGKGL